jgi:hypothetical protein
VRVLSVESRLSTASFQCRATFSAIVVSRSLSFSAADFLLGAKLPSMRCCGGAVSQDERRAQCLIELTTSRAADEGVCNRQRHEAWAAGISSNAWAHTHTARSTSSATGAPANKMVAKSTRYTAGEEGDPLSLHAAIEEAWL